MATFRSPARFRTRIIPRRTKRPRRPRPIQNVELPDLLTKAADEMTGAMVCLWLGEDDRFPAQPEQQGMLHITLAYLGEAAALDVHQRQTVLDVCTVVAAGTPTLRGSAGGITMWQAQDGPCASVPVDIPGLGDFRHQLVAGLRAAGINVASNHDFNAHLTLGEPWTGPMPKMVGPHDLAFTRITTALGPERHDARLGLTVQGTS